MELDFLFLTLHDIIWTANAGSHLEGLTKQSLLWKFIFLWKIFPLTLDKDKERGDS